MAKTPHSEKKTKEAESMAGPRQPIELIIAKGNKHLTKEEIASRMAREVKPCADDLTPPTFLTAAQKRQFHKIAGQLEKIGIIGETDTDALARYITAQSFYEQATKDLRAAMKVKPDKSAEDYYAQMELRANSIDAMGKLQDRYFKQAQTAAAGLGLTITSRCKLEVPVKEEAPKVNKFSRFGKAVGDE